MAVAPWSDLPMDIILLIEKILSSDVDTIRLRSICSHWLSSVPRRYRPSSFPLKVPPLFFDHEEAQSNSLRFLLRYTTVYRISPPEFGPCAGDPSDGFLLRVSEVRPNTFSLLPLMNPQIAEFDPALAPKRLNLLDFRVSEICKSYDVVRWNYDVDCAYLIARATVIWNYDVDCAFIVVVLKLGILYRWKFGDLDWFVVETGDRELSDLIVHDGKCYAIDKQGLLVVVDSKFNVTVVPSLPRLPVYPHKDPRFFLARYKSELYVLSITLAADVMIFKKGNGIWEHIRCLGDKMFLFCDDAILGLSSKDFCGWKANCVWFSPVYLHPYSRYDDTIVYAEYDLEEDRFSLGNWGEGNHKVICRPPPKWLLSS